MIHHIILAGASSCQVFSTHAHGWTTTARICGLATRQEAWQVAKEMLGILNSAINQGTQQLQGSW